MMRRISVAEVELGMFIQKLEGSWFKHPFWKAKFLLDDEHTLEVLRASEVDGVLIDTGKGRDIEPPVARGAPALLPARAPAAPRRLGPALAAGRNPAAAARQGLAREFGHARNIAARSEKIMSRVFFDSRLGKAIDSTAVEPVISDIFASIQRNPHAFNGLMRCKRDNEYIFQHALAVSALMISLARGLQLPGETVREAGMAGLLLDVGIGHLPLDTADLEGDYRDIADDLLRKHTVLGSDFLRMGGGIPDAVAQAVLEHHERCDGSGYPSGLRGDEITPLARMAAICDVYDGLVTDRSSFRGLDPAAAIARMGDMEGQFDPDYLAAFVHAIGVHPVGSVVRLASDRLALVIDQEPGDHRLPRVRTFYSIRTGKLTRAQDICLSQCFGEDSIVGAADPDDYGIEDFATLRLRIFTAACKA